MRKNIDGKFRFLSLVLAALTIVNAVSFVVPTTNAEEVARSVNISVDNTGEITGVLVDSKSVDVTEYLSSLSTHPNDNIVVSTTAAGFNVPASFILGTEEQPFNGSFTFTTGSTAKLLTTQPIFAYVNSSVEISSITVVRNQNLREPLLAENVIITTSSLDTPKNWIVTYAKASEEAFPMTFGGVVGQISVKEGIDNPGIVNIEFRNGVSNLNALYYQRDGYVERTSHAGLICSELKENAKLAVKLSGESLNHYVVASATGAAGGIVGKMGENSILRFDSDYSPDNVTIRADGTVSGYVTSGTFGAMAPLSLPAAPDKSVSIQKNNIFNEESEEIESESTDVETTESENIKPEVTEPETIEPESTEQEVTEPETIEPESTEQEVTEPETIEPESTEQEVTEPETIEPESTEQEVTEPETIEPESIEPEVAEPETTEPEGTEPEVAELETTEPEGTEPEDTEPETTEAESAEPKTTDLLMNKDKLALYQNGQKGMLLGASDPANGYAGGIVGYADRSSVIISQEYSVNITNSSVYATKGAGGFIGYCKAQANYSLSLDDYSINTVTLEGAVSSGGLFGVLESDASPTITQTDSNVHITSSITAGSNRSGLIGTYYNSNLANSLSVQSVRVSTATNSTGASGGIIGKILGQTTDDSAAYVKVEDVTASITGDTAFSGGIVGDFGANDSFLDLSGTNTVSGAVEGGIVGDMHSGVLRLAGSTDVSGTTSGKNIVNKRNYGLVYAMGSGTDYSTETGNGWTLNRAGGLRAEDDIGTWGEVIRLFGSDNAEKAEILSNVNHVVTVAAPANPMASRVDFAKTALNIQLNVPENRAGALLFTDTLSNSATLLDSKLSISKDSDGINLSGTGLTGFTRDDGVNAAFTGTFTGNDKQIDLAVGEAYGKVNGVNAEPDGQNSGKIYGGNTSDHAYTGLFAKIGDATVTGLKLGGSIYEKCRITSSIGTIAAYSNGSTNLVDNTVITQITVEPEKDDSKIGGAIGRLEDGTGEDGTGETVKITGGTYSADMINKTKSGFFGGVIGAVMDNRTVNVSGVTLSSDYENKSNGAVKYGGLICYISDSGAAVNIGDVVIDGMDITSITNNATGSLLGYIWDNATVRIGPKYVTAFDPAPTAGITVQNSCSITETTASASVSAFVYAATGKMFVDGIAVKSVGLSVSKPNGGSFGFIVNKATYNDASALYLEVNNASGQYDIKNTEISGTYTVFDEITAFSRKNGANYTILDNDAAVVSIETPNAKKLFEDNEINTYQNQTDYGKGGGKFNVNTRYYYNIGSILNKASKTPGEKLLLWSLKKYSHSSIQSHFDGGFFGNGDITGDIVLSGLSYYPVSANPGTIHDAIVTFASKAFDDGEALSGGDNYARPSTKDAQHLLMHSGILYDVSGALAVSNLTLKGDVGLISGNSVASTGSGFLVRGTYSDHEGTTTNTSDIKLFGATVNGGSTATYAPLLINRIEGHATRSTNLNLSGVKTVKNGENSSYTADQKAATSLIGKVGETVPTNINLEFSEIALDARITNKQSTAWNAADRYGGTTSSIFTKATLLDSFKYTAGSGVYNYVLAEDWDVDDTDDPHLVTYGWEVTNSSEYSDLEDKYLDHTAYTHPTTENCQNPGYDFSATDWLPYVRESYDLENNYHELRVNVKFEEFENGCGHFSDPYIIENGEQLFATALILNGMGPDTSYTININNDFDPNSDSHEHSTYQYNGTKFIKTSGNSGKGEALLNEVREYLAGAYYKVRDKIGEETVATITVGSNFIGLGTVRSEAEYFYAFRGVINGNNAVIVNESAAPLITNSIGSAVYDLTVKVNASFTKTASGRLAFMFNGGMESYGAVIGKVMGGDNFIDNVGVTVEGTNIITLSGDYRRLIPVGGYVGVVLNGTLVFRNMTGKAGLGEVVYQPNGKQTSIISVADNLPTETHALSTTTTDAWLYVNPYVGRVIAGHVLSEGCEINNGSKNYDIPLLDPASAADKLTVTADKVTVNGPQSLWALAAIVNTGAGAATSDSVNYSNFLSSSYTEKVKILHTDDGYDWQAWRDYCTARSGAAESGCNYAGGVSCRGLAKTPYIIRAYVFDDSGSGGNSQGYARTLGGNSNWNMELAADCDMTNYSGFRGIGNFYVDEPKLTLSAASIYSKENVKKLIKHNTRYLEYDINKENYQAFENAGFGLLNNVKQAADIHDLYIGGTILYDKFKASTGVPIEGIDDKNKDGYAGTEARSALSVGGVIGLNNFDGLELTNVEFYGPLNITSVRYAGGLVGISNSSFTITNCGSADETGVVTIKAAYAAGGLAGRCIGASKNVVITGKPSNVYIGSLQTFDRQTGNMKIDFQGGGVVGFSGRGASESNHTITISQMNVIGGTISTKVTQDQTKAYMGGIIGDTYEEKTTVVTDCHVSNVSIKGVFASGGIIGKAQQGIEISDVSVINDTQDDTLAIEAINSAGGIIGKMDTYVANITNAKVSGYTIKSSGSGNNNYNSAGGVIGFSYNDKNDDKLKNITVIGCEITTNNTTGAAGGVIGYNNGRNVLGDNILVNNTKTSNTNASEKAAALVGFNNAKPIKLVAVSVQNATDYTPVGNDNYGTGGYIVYSDYNGAALSAQNRENASIDNDVNTNTDSPYVGINPGNPIGGSDGIPSTVFITGDGFASGSIPGTNIISEMVNGTKYSPTSKTYTYEDGASTITHTIDKLTEAMSTYNAENPNATVLYDFPVLTVESARAAELTNLINMYLNYLLNTHTAIDSGQFDFGTANKSVYTVSMSRMGFNSVTGNFETKLGSSIVKNGNFFEKNGDNFDNTKEQFTLFDIAFKDPTTPAKNVFHLYAAVIVRKQLEFKVTVRPVSGTWYYPDAYAGSSDILVENLGTPVTLKVDYEYSVTPQEWADMITGGDDLSWNFDKTLSFRLTGLEGSEDIIKKLGSHTRFVLVDRQTHETYYAGIEALKGTNLELNGNSYIDFQEFKKADGVTAFSPVPLRSLLSEGESTPGTSEQIQVTEAYMKQETVFISSKQMSAEQLRKNGVPEELIHPAQSDGKAYFIDGGNGFRPKVKTDKRAREYLFEGNETHTVFQRIPTERNLYVIDNNNEIDSSNDGKTLEQIAGEAGYSYWVDDANIYKLVPSNAGETNPRIEKSQWNGFYTLQTRETNVTITTPGTSSVSSASAEGYYLTIITDETDLNSGEVNHYSVEGPRTLTESTGTHPSKRVLKNLQNDATHNSAELLLGNIYETHNVEVNALTSDPIIKSSNDTVEACVVSTIGIADKVKRDFTDRLMQASAYYSTRISLNRKNADGSLSDTIYGQPLVTAEFTIEKLNDGDTEDENPLIGSYLTAYPTGEYIDYSPGISDNYDADSGDDSDDNDGIDLMPSLIAYDSVRITTYVNIVFEGGDGAIEEEFPQEPDDANNPNSIGVRVSARSNVGNSPEESYYSRNTDWDMDTSKLYLSPKVTKTPLLQLLPIKDDKGDISQLGYNSIDDTGDFVINAEGTLDISQIYDDINRDFKTVDCWVRLYKKVDGTTAGDDVLNYVLINNIGDYISNCNISTTDATKTRFIKANLEVDESIVRIPLNFKFIKRDEYANYRIELLVWVNSDDYPDAPDKYAAKDFLVFTYAKLLPDFID